VSKYRKQIEVTDTGMIVAQVFAEGGRRVGLKFHHPSVFGFNDTVAKVEKACQKAHAWADAHMAMCERNEVMPKPKTAQQLLDEIDLRLIAQGKTP
jgi:hypothetical protein